MAKKRRVSPRASTRSDDSLDPQAESQTTTDQLLPMMIAAAMLGGACVYLSYHPSDGVAVEDGDALWFAVIALLLGTLTWGYSLWTGGNLAYRQQHAAGGEQPSPGPASPTSPAGGRGEDSSNEEDNSAQRLSVVIDLIPWLLAGWMMLAAFATSPPGNLRAATNEAWLWVSGAAVFSSARRLLVTRRIQVALLALLVVCATGLAIHGLHQQFFSLPESRIDYRKDPDETLRKLGMDAPAGSAERMIFESRLFDGGPTGTFALANSLAAVLVVGLIVSLGVCWFCWPSAGLIARIGCCASLVLCLACLIAVRSRSAMLAAMTATVLLFVWAASASNANNGRSTIGILVKGMLAIVALVIATVVGLAALGNAEWIDQAPASVAFRLQYWRSTLAMTFDRPLFSAGPGNFQSIYLRYREDSASEQIAEPHNFLFETMASGGFPALTLLCVWLAAIAWFLRRRNRRGTNDANEQAGDKSASWVGLGAGVALALLWLMGAAAGRVPDVSAHRFVVPLAVALGWAIWPAVRTLKQDQVKLIASAALVALLIHLLAAGGWTIPGVAIHVWVLAAVLTCSQNRFGGMAVGGRRSWSLGTIAMGILMLAALRSMSLIPVQTAKNAISSFEFSHRRGQMRQAEAALDRAIEADTWSPAATLWRADLLHWQLVTEGDSAELRRSWGQYLQMTKERAGEEPSLWEVIGGQQLHLYQRFGNDRDLAAAEQTFTRVVQWDQADQHAVAQLAAIAASRGDLSRAKKLADRAFYLAGLGNNIERALELQLIYVPQHQGLAAASKPIRAAASELLANHLR